jgi:ADP-ribose pyrophosphatase
MRGGDFGMIDDGLTEHTIASESPWQGGFLKVQRDTVRLPDGSQATREFLQHNGAVMVVPILDDGRLVLERQHRHPLGRTLIEFPAGKIDPGEAPFQCALRELEEETGYRATEWARACVLHNAPAYSTEGIEIWFARGLAAGAHRRDAGEFIEVFEASEAELAAMVGRGEITDAKTMIGLLWLQKSRSGEWPLVWRPESALA